MSYIGDHNFNINNPYIKKSDEGKQEEKKSSTEQTGEEQATVAPAAKELSADAILSNMAAAGQVQANQLQQERIANLVASLPVTNDEAQRITDVISQEFPGNSEIANALLASEFLVNQTIGVPEVIEA